MGVLEHDEQGRRSHHTAQQVDHEIAGVLAADGSRHRASDVVLVEIHGQEGVEQRCPAGSVGVGGDGGLGGISLLLEAMGLSQAQQPGHHGAPRSIGRAPLDGVTRAEVGGDTEHLRPLQQPRDQHGLANTRIPAHQDQPTLPPLSKVHQGALEHAPLGTPADDGPVGELALLHRHGDLDGVRLARPHRPVGNHRLALSLDARGIQDLEVHARTHRPSRRLATEDLVACELHEPGGQIHRVPEDRVLPPLSVAVGPGVDSARGHPDAV